MYIRGQIVWFVFIKIHFLFNSVNQRAVILLRISKYTFPFVQRTYIYAFILIYISPFLFGTTKIYLCVYSHLHTSLFTGDNRNIFIRLFSITYLPLYLEHLDIFMCLFSPTFSFHFYWEHHRYICVFIFTKIVSPPLRYILEDMSSCMFFPPTPPPFTVYTRGHIHLCNFSFLCSIFSIVVSTFSFDLCVF